MVYLVEKYGKTASLYPSDPKARAIVNQRMYFDMGTLYERLAAYYYPQIFAKAPANPENMKKLEEAVGYLNTFLEGQTYAVSFKLLSLLFFFCISWGEETENKQHLLVVHISFTGWWQFNCCGYHVGGHRINSRCCIVRFIEISKRCCMVWTMQSYRSRLWHQRSRSCRIQEILQLNAIMHMRKVCYELLKFGTHTHTFNCTLH